jgi:hypothetical protein
LRSEWLAGARDQFEGLCGGVDRLVEQGRYEEAIALAKIAAHGAWKQHPGSFGSSRLEDALARCAEGLPPSLAPRRLPRGEGWPARVLHAFTETSAVGGHTRVAWRWICADPGRRHDLVLHDQGLAALPRPLSDAVRASGGSLESLSALGGGPLRKAARLRELAALVDLVVLHVHPFDVLPVLAFRGAVERPVIAVFNHADHVFWIGGASCDAVLNLRDSGAELSAARRGIEPERNLLLPLPIDVPPRTRSRAEAKARLGVPAQALLCVTIASEAKYEAPTPAHFVTTLAPLLDRHPELHLRAVGPRDTGLWRAERERTGGRVRALGVLDDLGPLHEAADIGIDSFPFNSITSRLECGLYEVPLVGYSPHPEGAEVLRSPIPVATMLREFDLESFRSALEWLLTDPEERERRGRATAQEIRSQHVGDAWLAHLGMVYAGLRALGRSPGGSISPERSEPIDLALWGAGAARSRSERGFWKRVVRKHFAGLSPLQRARLLAGPLRSHVDPDLGLVLPWRLPSHRRGRGRPVRRSAAPE